MSADSPHNSSRSDQPTRALLLAQALEMCIRAEKRMPGSADQLIARQPAWARTELRRLVALAGSLEATATNAVISDEFRAAARERLLRRITARPDAGTQYPTLLDGHRPVPGGWLAAVPSDNRRNGHQVA